MLLNQEDCDKLAKMKIEMIDSIFELNNIGNFVDYGKNMKTIQKEN